MLENKIESYLVSRVKELGGKCVKFVSPGLRGVPDRIVMFKGRGTGYTIFIETKQPEGVLRKQQEHRIKEFKVLGQQVCTLYSKEQVDSFIDYMLDCMKCK
jgi:hypothetical protein